MRPRLLTSMDRRYLYFLNHAFAPTLPAYKQQRRRSIDQSGFVTHRKPTRTWPCLRWCAIPGSTSKSTAAANSTRRCASDSSRIRSSSTARARRMKNWMKPCAPASIRSMSIQFTKLNSLKTLSVAREANSIRVCRRQESLCVWCRRLARGRTLDCKPRC